jgi:hypothetical protein
MRKFFSAAVLLFVGSWLFSHAVEAATASSAVLEAKKSAESKGFTFLTSRDEIVAKAKQEGTLRVISSLDTESFKPMMESFTKISVHQNPMDDQRSRSVAAFSAELEGQRRRERRPRGEDRYFGHGAAGRARYQSENGRS